MTATTMHFGPEWMRKQPAPAPAKPLATSPPPGGSGGYSNGGSPATLGAPSYSALVAPHVPHVQEKRDIAHPFRYSRDEILQVYKDLGGCIELPIEVERWEGIVRDSTAEPVSLNELTEVERKLYATSLNSENRRRQSSDYANQGDRLKGNTLNSGLGLMGRRRRGDSNGAEHPPLSLPRKTSWSSTPGNLVSPSMASPRARKGSSNVVDGAVNGNDMAWGGGKWRAASGHTFSGRVDEEEETPKDPASTETKEETTSTTERFKAIVNSSPNDQGSSASQVDMPRDSTGNVNEATIRMDNLDLHTKADASKGPLLANSGELNSLDPTDLGKVEWSYIDPSGSVQGPFVAERMQLWHDQHYFADDLMMKRSAIDNEFISLAEIRRRAQGERIFLSPLSNTAPPPGLGHPIPAAGVNSLLQRTGIVDAPRQPIPQSFARSNTLDSIINTGPIANGSGSPSSSIGGSMARGPISPDPITIGSRIQRLASDAPINGRLSAAGSYSSHSSPAVPQAVRQVFNEPSQANRPPSFDTQVNLPWQITHGNNSQGWNGPSDVSQLGASGRFEQVLPQSLGQSQFMRDSSYVGLAGPTPVEPFLPSSVPSHTFYEQPQPSGGTFHQMSHDPSVRFDGVPRQPSLSHLNTGFNGGFEQTTSPSVPSAGTGNFQHQPHIPQATPLSPWGVPQAHEPPRPRPFDAELPNSNNTFVVSLPQTSVWNRPRTQDPWAPALQAPGQVIQDQLTEEPQSLTTANVIHHNEQQTLRDAQNVNASSASVNAVNASTRVTVATADTAPTTVAENQASLASPSKEPTAKTPAPKRKVSAAPAAPSPAPAKAQSGSITPVSKAPAAPSAPQKAAWAADPDSNVKSSTPTNLRDIQEAEKKKQEARKNAERERERAARAASAASPTEEVQFTASWGLPSSQVGTRSNGAPALKEAPAASPGTATSAHVWTNAAKPPAKTMKEIQEEEERRNIAAKERETAATAAKRAAQASPAKAPPVNAQSVGGAWSVVGAGGKSQTTGSVAASRPVAQASTPSAAVSRPAAVHRPTTSPVVVKAASSTPKRVEEPRAPSLQFMKWMRESLRDLNSSVQFEEIAHMLLSFPLDPDRATKEIIAETVYVASRTLNGHDFAEEFIRKRKEDVQTRPKSASNQAANGKPVSLADVVKAQPKPPQDDFGAFKVVKKKSKRS